MSWVCFFLGGVGVGGGEWGGGEVLASFCDSNLSISLTLVLFQFY